MINSRTVEWQSYRSRIVVVTTASASTVLVLGIGSQGRKQKTFRKGFTEMRGRYQDTEGVEGGDWGGGVPLPQPIRGYGYGERLELFQSGPGGFV